MRLSLTWDAYQKNICNGLGLLQQRGEFVDMTIAADGHYVKVHQMVLSLVSPFIKELITSVQCPHPVIFLNQVSHQTLQSVLEYAYTGEVLVTRDNLNEFLEACRALSIKGFEGETLSSSIGKGSRHLVEETDVNASVEPAETDNIELCPKTGVKRKRVDPPEEYNDETVNGSGHTIINSEVEYNESQFEEDYYLEESMPEESQPDNSKVDDQINPPSSSMIQYTVSCQGSIQIVLNRYLYRLRHVRKSNERMWRCQDYYKKGCQAFILTNGDVIIQRGCAHNHSFHDQQILKRIHDGNMFSTYNAVQKVAALQKKVLISKR